MKVQVLVAAMNQNDYSLIKKMNLQTDAVIGNQCDRCSDENINYNNSDYIYINRTNRGVGFNRNEALINANADILTFADEDMVFENDYEKLIQKAFSQIADADAIIFNIKTVGANANRRTNDKIQRVRFYNVLNYGAARISVKSSSLKRENIFFHTCFGGGTRYSSGEDTLFIVDMLKHGFKIYTYPVCIGSVDQTSSTWFKGYNEKYFFDKGVLFAAINRKLSVPLCLQDLIRHKEYLKSNLNFKQAYKLMKNGISSYNRLMSYEEFTHMNSK